MGPFLKRYVTLFAVLAVFGCTRQGPQKTAPEAAALHMAVEASPKGLDPAIHAVDPYANVVIAQIFEPLFQYNYLRRPFQLEALVALGGPLISEDRKTYTLQIKPGVRFHDHPAFPGGKGRELVAEDFIFSWKRLADPNLKSEAFWIFDRKIVGLNEWRAKRGLGQADYSTPVAGLAAPDSRTLVIRLTQPYPQLIAALAMTATAAVPREVLGQLGPDFAMKPVGTGPYRTIRWERGQKIELERHPDYHANLYPADGEPADQKEGLLKDAGRRLPLIDKVVVHEWTEDASRWQKVEMGLLDWASVPAEIFPTAFPGGRLREDLTRQGLGGRAGRDLEVTYTAFNLSHPVLGRHTLVRQAIALAIDTKDFIARFYNHQAMPAQGLLPADLDGHDPNFQGPFSRFDLERAKDLLRKAGYPEGRGLPEIDYHTTTAPTALKMAEFFKENLARLGVRLRVVEHSWSDLMAAVQRREASMFTLSWIADYPDPQNFFQLLYGANARSGLNSSGFRDAEFDRLYERAERLPRGEERTRLYGEMQRVIAERVPILPHAHRVSHYVHSRRLRNFKPHHMIPNFVKYLALETESERR